MRPGPPIPRGIERRTPDELELPVDLLTDLCARHGVRLAAGAQTRLPVAEHAILAERAETERAFRE